MEAKVLVTIQVDDHSGEFCRSHCGFSDSNQYCQLFGISLDDGRRCNQCIENEIKD